MKPPRIRPIVLYLAILAGLLLTQTGSAAERPDLTGVWTFYPEPGSSRSAFMPWWPADAPFSAEGRKKRDEYQALVADTGDNPGGFCLGYGMPASMLSSGAYPMEIVQRHEQITVIYQAHTEVRRIYIDAAASDLTKMFPSRGGYSTGRWEGDTLIVETSRLYEAVDQLSAHSDQAKLTERYTLTTDAEGLRVLAAELTLEDPVFYTAPVTVTKKWLEMKGGRMQEYECNESAWEDRLETLRQKAKQE